MTDGFPVVDGDTYADIYGYATSADEAKQIADDCFTDEVCHVELYEGKINLSDGTTMEGKVWVAFTDARSYVNNRLTGESVEVWRDPNPSCWCRRPMEEIEAFERAGGVAYIPGPNAIRSKQ